VCDTSRARPDDIVDLIVAALDGFLGREILLGSPPLLLMDPARLYPTADIRQIDDIWDPAFVQSVGEAGPAGVEPIAVGYADFNFFVLDGHRRLSAALQSGFHLIPARLVAEREEMVNERTALRYFESKVTANMVDDWSEAHKIELPLPAHILRQMHVLSAKKRLD
jgi:CMP/dCMP kinase